MTDWMQVAADAYRAEIARAEAAGLVADTVAAQDAARCAVLDVLRGDPAMRAVVENAAATAAARAAHKNAVDGGKRQIEEVANGQLPFSDMGVLEAVIPLGEGALSTFGYLNDDRLDMADEVRRQNQFVVNRKYQEWSDGVRRPVKKALRQMLPGSTVQDAVDQGKL